MKKEKNAVNSGHFVLCSARKPLGPMCRIPPPKKNKIIKSSSLIEFINLDQAKLNKEASPNQLENKTS